MNMSSRQETTGHLNNLHALEFHPTIEPKPQGPFCKIPGMKEFEESVERYDSDLTILGRLLAMDGVKPRETLEKEREDAKTVFRQSGRTERIEAHSAVIAMIEARLPRQFDTQLKLYGDLKIDEGMFANNAKILIDAEKKQVSSRSRMERFEALLGVKSDVDVILTKGLPRYIDGLRHYLIRIGEAQSYIDTEIKLWEYRYNGAPDELKPNVANLIRLRLKTAPGHDFDSLLLDYRIEISRWAVPINKSFVNPAQWQDKFRETEDPDRKIDIIRGLRAIVDKYRGNLDDKLATATVTPSIY